MKEQSWYRMVMQLLIFMLGVFCLAAGVMNGGYRDTLIKAIMVCLECIGIG
ncbi:MAG: CD1871A family CXXC motif-containing protein [Lachnospiraceae bacterium]|nr:CD1871A family CXXC motif-containing protein [Lachnospiraceae bacterium]